MWHAKCMNTIDRPFLMWIPRWQSLVDLAVVTVAVYLLLAWAKEARALRIALGIVALRAAAVLAHQLELAITAWVFDAASVVVLVLLLVIFQPELRRALLHLDFGLRRRPPDSDMATTALVSICDAAFSLASTGRGALIVLVRRDPVDSLMIGGVPLGGAVSKEILEAIFRKVSPVHDGATIVEGDRIARVGAILPLTDSIELPSEFGTRHRAAFGLTEKCDASVIVVSEERGTVTLVRDRQYWRIGHVEDLARHLQDFGSAPVTGAQRKWRRNLGLKAIAMAMAVLVWMVSYSAIGTTVRNVLVPIEFTNVPAGMDVTGTSDSTMLQVQLRGTSWLFESASLSRMSARVDLRAAPAGKLTVRVNPEFLQPPPGIRVERISPEAIQLELVRH
jgi:diadenylate cyclase